MTKNEMTKRMEKLEHEMFLLEMKDRWNTQDFDNKRKMFNEWLELKNELAKI